MTRVDAYKASDPEGGGAEGDVGSAPRPRSRDLLARLGYRLAWRLLSFWWWTTGGEGRGVGVALWHEDRLLVLRPSYRTGFCLPGGGLRRGEAPLAGALRELREETGIVLSPGRLRSGPCLRFEEGRRRITERVFEVRLAKRPPVVVDGREIMVARWLTREELALRSVLPGLRAYLEHFHT